MTSLVCDPERRTVTGVATTRGPVAAGAVAVCGGAWSPSLAEALDVRLPVRPLKGQIVHLSLSSADTRSWTIVQPVLGFYLVPWPDGRVACGGTMEDAGFDARPTAEGLHQLLREGLRTAPGLRTATVVETRAGLRPSSEDGDPIVGRLPGWENAYVATGHGAEGLLLGPFSARVLADQMLGIEPGGVAAGLAERHWAPDRFDPDRPG